MRNCIPSAPTLVILALAALPATAQTAHWIRQVGTSASDRLYAAAPDGSGGVYVGGNTEGGLGGPNAGLTDAWLARYDSSGNQTWIRQLGTTAADNVSAVAPDGAGGVYLGGSTDGSLGGPNAGVSDAWLARYDSMGNRTWIRQLGTISAEGINAVASDGADGAYVGGFTSGSLGGPNAGSVDAWLARYDGAGVLVGSPHQLGTTNSDYISAAASDGSGGVYVGGFTSGSLGGPIGGGSDAWLALYDSSGNRIWIRQLGTISTESTNAVVSDGSGGVYVGGQTFGNLSAPNTGFSDAWLARYDSAGNQTWIRQFGTADYDYLLTSAPDRLGGVHVGGDTRGSLGGPNAGVYDAWLAHYDGAGNQTSTQQLGTTSYDYNRAAATDGWGGVYAGGLTSGSLGGPNAGLDDAWFAHYDGPCGSGTSYCTAGTNSIGCTAAMSATGTPSVSASSGCTVLTSGAEGQHFGYMFYGINGAAAVPWGQSSATMCVAPPRRRMAGNTLATGTPGVCDGTFSLDWNTFLATHPTALGQPFSAGDRVWIQTWIRDPPNPKTTILSDALTFTMCP